jgi:CheY-specific phosphatase CheX
VSATFFGQYLLARGAIDAKLLMVALDRQENANTKLGARAVEAGMMTSAQVTEVYSLQRKHDQKFGEIAVKLGFLDPPTLDLLLTQQREDHVMLGHALVELGAFDEEALRKHLLDFEREVALEQDVKDLYRGRANGALLGMITETTLRMFSRLAHTTVKAGTCHGDADKVVKVAYAAQQAFCGAVNGLVCLDLSEGIVKTIASTMLESEVRRVDDDCLECIGEFLNIISGNIAARFSSAGHKVEIRPQEVHRFENSPFWRFRRRRPDILMNGPRLGLLTVTPLLHPTETIELCAAL